MSFSQARHLKCIIWRHEDLTGNAIAYGNGTGAVDCRRRSKEHDGKPSSRPTIVIKESGTPSAATEPGAAAPAAAPAAEAAKPADSTQAAKDLSKPKAPDPVEVWNGKLDQLRAKIRDLQDQETALQLQQTEIQNQVYAPVVDPAIKDQAQAALAENQLKLARVREDLDTFKKDLDTLQLAGPPKKN